ncbi:hypothetical protein ACN47E_006171 [Coniothyrium glycines]
MTKHSDNEVAWSGKQQERITISFLVLAWTFVLLRIWTRTWIISNFGWDDSTMILATLFYSVFCAATLYIEANGGGTHINSVPLLQLLTKWVVVSEAMYVVAMMTLKISLGIFYARIVVKTWQLAVIYTTVGINIFSSLASFFYCLFRCGPNLNMYVLQQLAYKCTPHKFDLFMAYQQAAFNTLTDLMFFLLPFCILWNSNMDRRTKISVGFILCLAALGCICSIIRFRYVDGLTQIDDFFWNAVNIAIWSTIEAGASIIAGCLATLRPFLKFMIRYARKTSSIKVCVTQISRSLRSGSTANSSSNASTIPRYHERPKKTRNETMELDSLDTRNIDTPTFVESMALPQSGIVTMGSYVERERASTDAILEDRGQSTLEYPWPVKLGIREDQDRKRQTVHGSWTMPKGSTGQPLLSERPLSAPIPLASHHHVERAV